MEGLPILNVRRSERLSPDGRFSFPRWFTRKRFEYRRIKASKVIAFVISASRARFHPDEIGYWSRSLQSNTSFVKNLRNWPSGFYMLVLYVSNADIYYFRRGAWIPRFGGFHNVEQPLDAGLLVPMQTEEISTPHPARSLWIPVAIAGIKQRYHVY